MAIRDPIDALEKQFENEERASDPIASRLAEWVAALPLPFPADKAVAAVTRRLNADRIEKIELMLEVMRDELRRHEDLIDSISNVPEAERWQKEWLALVQDGLKRAERTRAKTRVVRIGRILANSLVTSPRPAADDVEEMMRVAMELSDREVDFLKELARVQGDSVRAQGRIPRYDAWASWPNTRWGERVDPEIDSVFSKLDGLGLVVRLVPPNTFNIMADVQNRYALLRKGFEFIRFIERQ
jgi:hypothetical protein